MNLFSRAALLAALLLTACSVTDEPGNRTPPSATAVAPVLTSPDAIDTASFARPLEARVTHVALDLTVNFEARRLEGTATLDIDRRPDAKQIVLDDNGLDIAKIVDGSNHALPFTVGAKDPNLGSPLAIALRPDTKRIAITYKSAPNAGALLWLTPAADRRQEGALPVQPGRIDREPELDPDAGFAGDPPDLGRDDPRSSRDDGGDERSRIEQPITQGGESVFNFRMDHSVAPYMIAIAVGDLTFKSLGPRTGVWAEPATIEAAARELADTEKMVAAAEKLYGPYRWGRYDVLVLPPSFPYGGEENPNMTFLTPTFIAGDKSLVSLVAHELSHSWSGNLATNATWNDFWLNEGITTYAERRIVEELYGKKQADEEIALGIDALNKAVAENGGPSGPDTRLHLDLKGRNPDDGLTDIAYEKGAAFMRTVEAIVGRPRFDAWLKGWFNRHAFQPVTSAMLLADMRQNLVKGDKALESRLMLDRWVYQPGIPPNMARPPAGTFAEQDKAAAAFANGGPPPLAWGHWITDERLRFLNRLPRRVPKARLDALQSAFGLNDTPNMEVRFAWLDLAVGNRYDPAVPSLEHFLTSQGRGKFVRPLFKALAKDQQWGKPIATRVYAKARPLYHPLVTRDLDKLGSLSLLNPA